MATDKKKAIKILTTLEADIQKVGVQFHADGLINDDRLKLWHRQARALISIVETMVYQ
jgi:hypothetical protein